jgi:acetyltransferase-like isoleucine patch superfamily enzyme
MMENLHLLKTGRGTYFDRNINILSWTNDSKVIVGRYCSIARDCTFLLNANHRPDWVTTSTMLLGLVNPNIVSYDDVTPGRIVSKRVI